RKYRPVTFQSVVGQQHITTTLKNALKNQQLAQAFLFCGPRGVGKTTCARILAKTINCLNPTEDYEACGICDSCRAFQQKGSLNIYELDAASNNSVEDIRNLVDQVRFPPQIGNRKVYIIDEVHMLSTSAFNAFLKTLEEPPEYVIFILATTEKHKIIPTILSRCQIFDFKRIEIKDMAQHLAYIADQENIKTDPEALELIAQKADGGLRDALSLFDMLSTFSPDEGISLSVALDNLHILDYDYYFRLTEALLQEKIADALLILNDILGQGFDAHNFIAGLAQHFRDLMVCRDERTLTLLEVSQRVKQNYQTQSQLASPSFLLSALNLASKCEMEYKTSKNPRLLLELCLMKIAHIPSLINWEGLENKVEKKKLTEDPAQTKAEETTSVEYHTNPKQISKTDATPNQSSHKKEENKAPTESSSENKHLIPLSLEALEKATEENLQKDKTPDAIPLSNEEIRKGIEFYKK
ncbi:MAG: DNA polymerase III subunit gamma/tau, partial [Bacteroidota bacterium]